MKNILKLLAKSVLILLGLAAAASPTDAAIHKDIFGSGITIFIISNEEKSDVMKIVQSLVKFGLLIKGVSKTIKKEAMKQKSGFLSMFRYIRFQFISKSIKGNGVMRAGERTIIAGEGKINTVQTF